jgi:hypothetical protein
MRPLITDVFGNILTDITNKDISYKIIHPVDNLNGYLNSIRIIPGKIAIKGGNLENITRTCLKQVIF